MNPPAKPLCDIVMKGGITSGVVYPLAVRELARVYRFKSIGGTSAGAIAAALTAAAELRARQGSDAGFEELARLPQVLEKKLLSFFQPAPAARPAFRVLLALIGPGAVPFKITLAAAALLRSHPVASLLGAGLGVGVAEGLLVFLGAAPSPVALGTWRAASALLGLFLVSLVAFVGRAWRALGANNFGLCSGTREGREDALGEWLTRQVNEVAGKEAGGDPLTFGELWRGRPGPAAEDEKIPPLRDRAINLEVVTSNLTHGRPYRIPFESRAFHFRPDELRRVLPGPVVEFMKSRSTPARFYPAAEDSPWRLPAPADLPVVAAVRMSLSFPLLLSAVPLYAVDWGRPENQEGRDDRRLEFERCWFSDGGIGSNFPIHFFDALVPGRPTFGINLRPFPRDQRADPADQARNVHFPRTAQQEVIPDWNRFRGLTGFVRAILETMQNWVDSTQMKLPGYHDRVVHIHFEKHEGGLNLEMPKDVVGALTRRGEAAGRMLVSEFDWSRHRWTRYRTAFAEIQEALEGLERVWGDESGPGGKSFGDFLAGRDFHAPPYALARGDRALRVTRQLVALAESWRDEGVAFTSGAPRPDPDLRIRPRI